VVDLLKLTAELVDIPSVSHHEGAVTDHLESLLSPVPWLSLTRVGDNLVARTELGRSHRLVLAGHTDTVPPNGNERARVEGDVLWGLGSCDMKSGVAVLAELARTVEEPAVDTTYVFYECEEVDARFNGIERLFRERPDVLEGDAALLAEPTSARVEAGCQGTMRVEVEMAGERAHTARAWLGRNAIHRLAPLLAAVAAYEGRRVSIDGCHFREGLQVVRVTGGVANNVVPDRATVTLNHRFAPDRSEEDALAHMREVFDGHEIEVSDSAPAAMPGLSVPAAAAFVEAVGGEVNPKFGWTDVARFSQLGVPAVNFGPGDPQMAHKADEFVPIEHIHRVEAQLRSWLGASDG